MRKFVMIAAVCLLAAAVYLSLGTGAPARPQSDRAAPAGPEASPLAQPTVPAKTSAPAPAMPSTVAATRDNLAVQQRDLDRREPLQRFQREMLAGLDGCMQQRPEARSSQRLELRFERDTAVDDQHQRFKLADIIPLGVAPGQMPIRSPSWHCFAALIGRTLVVPAGSSPQEPSFREVVLVPLPNSVGWSMPHPI